MYHQGNTTCSIFVWILCLFSCGPCRFLNVLKINKCFIKDLSTLLEMHELNSITNGNVDKSGCLELIISVISNR